MVMDKDEAIKENRLGLLKQIYSTMLTICDLSKIVLKKINYKKQPSFLVNLKKAFLTNI